MIAVEPFAGRVLRIARALVGAEPWAHAIAVLTQPVTPQPVLSPDAWKLLESTLVRGSARALLHRGGWCRRRFLDAEGQPGPERRAWEAERPPLQFTRATGELLRHLACATPGPLSEQRRLLNLSLSPADELALLLLGDGLPAISAAAPLVAWPAEHVASSPLAWLAHADRLCLTGVDPPQAEQFRPWLEPPLVHWIEMLERPLALRLVDQERSKRRVSRPEHMIALGNAQTQVLSAWLDACDAAHRRDLAGFLIEALALLLERPRPPKTWVTSLDSSGTLASRQHSRSAAGAVLRLIDRLDAWDREHRDVRWIDEGHAAAQLLVAQREALDGPRRAFARAVIAELDDVPPLEEPAS